MIVLAVPMACVAESGGDAERVAFSGYYKNLLTRSETLVPVHEPYIADLNRLRLEARGPLLPQLLLDLQYDNEIVFGDYLETAQFQAQKNTKDPRYLDLDSTWTDHGDLYGRQRLYRASLTWSQGDTDVRIGRQRIALGTGRFFSPLDRLNPVAPTILEREERPGVDAVLVEHKTGPVSRVSAIYSPARNRDSGALQWHGNNYAVDWSLVGGRFRGEDMVGGDIATQIGDGGLRAELTTSRPDIAPAYQSAVLGLDYAFPGTLKLSGEVYYNGAGATDKRLYDFSALLLERTLNLARHYAGFYAGYDVTPILKIDVSLVLNLDDGSRFFSPELTWSIRQDVDIAAGFQVYGGSTGSEYEFFRPVLFGQVKLYF